MNAIGLQVVAALCYRAVACWYFVRLREGLDVVARVTEHPSPNDDPRIVSKAEECAAMLRFPGVAPILWPSPAIVSAFWPATMLWLWSARSRSGRS